MREWAYGVDVSTRRIAFGAYAEGTDGPLVRAWSVEVPDGLDPPARLAAIRRLVMDVCHDTQPMQRPTLVVVEDANTGPSANKPLLAAVAVVVEGLYSALRCPVMEMPIGTWKRRSLGRGNAKKPEVWSHAVSLGANPQNQDEADAVCVAQAAHSLLEASCAWAVGHRPAPAE